MASGQSAYLTHTNGFLLPSFSFTFNEVHMCFDVLYLVVFNTALRLHCFTVSE